jgi:hypothetical protein
MQGRKATDFVDSHYLGVCCASRIKPPKIAFSGDFLPCKLPGGNRQENEVFSQPLYRGFHGFFQRKKL